MYPIFIQIWAFSHFFLTLFTFLLFSYIPSGAPLSCWQSQRAALSASRSWWQKCSNDQVTFSIVISCIYQKSGRNLIRIISCIKKLLELHFDRHVAQKMSLKRDRFLFYVFITLKMWCFSIANLLILSCFPHWNFYRTQVSLGSDLWVRFSQTNWDTLLKLNWCDSSWWRYQLNTNW